MWHDEYFHFIVLKQLGHSASQPCYNHKPTYDNDFTIIDVHGIYEVILNFCNCERAFSPYNKSFMLTGSQQHPPTQEQLQHVWFLNTPTYCYLSPKYLLSSFTTASCIGLITQVPTLSRWVTSCNPYQWLIYLGSIGFIFCLFENNGKVVQHQSTQTCGLWSRSSCIWCNSRRRTYCFLSCMPPLWQELGWDIKWC